jgi:hypothetical protein
LLTALANGHTIRDAEALAGIGERTATRYVANSDFRRKVAEFRGEMVQRAVGRRAYSSAEAVETLRRLLNAPNDDAKLGAARSILELGNRLREAVELEQRIAALEECLGRDRETQ